jgi:hypothetical protein
MEERDLAVTLARGRIAFGVVSLLAPGLVARTMTGGGRSDGGTRLFVRMIGARDLGVGLGLHVALDRDAPTRGWLEASAVIDGIDLAACLFARHHLRPGVFPGTLGAAATGTLLSVWLARQLEPAPPRRHIPDGVHDSPAV